ncbi:hypothetical protein RND81_07G199200 [Saponaria officinalis]|uniref:Late embryogenesis abundant protein LEA-2 subgroup domain-containing protein n=1 Tax=Saponaria officinalis TaxID=3572 RepID=A0AAW1JQG2_SAPOF
MSEYGAENNPYFQPRQQFQQQPMQQWDHHPTQIPQSDLIRPRTRPHSQSPTSAAHPLMSHQPEHDHQHPMPHTVHFEPSEHRPNTHPHPTVGLPERPPNRHSYPIDGRPERPPNRHSGPVYQPKPKPTRQSGGPPHENLRYPEPSRTRPVTWCGAVFCVVLWLVIIFGGLLVLIIYLVYRPQTPRFEIPTASLNAIYLDMGSLLNADLTVLVNFTNPNKQVNVKFSYVILQLYFENHLIANQYIEPFATFSAENKLANVEIVSSRVRLPVAVTQELVTQMQRNRIIFEVDGIFHATSNFGSLLRYSYWLYGHCSIEMTGPPSGIMVARRCYTKD